jgi:acyl-CoA thioester hydrolase
MDMLGHVNNVTYVDYLQEARVDMFTTHAPMDGGEELGEGVVVVRHEVDYVAPLTFRRASVRIDSWVTQVRAASFTMAYEVYDETPEGRHVYLRASSVLAPFVFDTERPRRITAAEREVLGRFLEDGPARERMPFAGGSRHVYPLRVRWSDVDAYRHVNNVQYFEFLQESRIQFLMDLHQHGDNWSNHVVARTDVDYRRPIFFRLEPYAVHSWISHVGTKSFTIASEIRDGDEVLARGQVVMVTFDRETQRAAPMAPDQRTRLVAELEAATAAPGT